MMENGNFFRTSDGVNIYFEDYGVGEPLLLLPGFMCTAKFFKKNKAELSKDNRLIIMESRGHGLSGKCLTGLQVPRMAQDVKELLEYLDLKQVTFLGWSLGGPIAMSYYEQFGDYRLKRIGMLDSALYPFGDEIYNAHSLHGHNMEAFCKGMKTALESHSSYCKAFLQKIFKHGIQPEDEGWLVEETTKCPPWIAFAIYEDYLHRNYIPVLPLLKIPVLICGADSPTMPNGINMANEYSRMVKAPCMFHPFEDAGHILFYESPDEFHKVVLDFMKFH